MMIGRVLHAWRATAKLSLRQAAPIVGLSATTLSRIETGKETLDGRTMLKLTNWLFGSKGDVT